MNATPPGLLEAFEAFRVRLLAAPSLLEAGQAAGLEAEEAQRLLEMYVNEARVGLDLIAPLLKPGLRVLDVGCGIGALGRFLLEQGFDVVGIEPGAPGFSFMPAVARAILDLAPGRSESWLPIGAEELDPMLHGAFDLVVSVNVLEHIPDLEGAVRGMASVLKPGGTMVHLCPNYVVPYEPHFGLPLLPLKPGLTRHLFPSTVAGIPGVWDELNFITAPRLARIARRHGLQVAFDRGVLSDRLRRLETDPLFRARQGRLALAFSAVIRTLRLADLLAVVPGQYLTPMVVRLGHAA